MRKRFYAIEFHHACERHSEENARHESHTREHHEHEDEHSNVNKSHHYRAKMKDVFGEVEGFMKYEEKHGMHFSDKLSAYVSSKMINISEVNKDTLQAPETPKHSWTANEVEEAFKKLGLSFEQKHKYDYHYAANMAYADFFGESLKEESACLKHAHAMVHDPDGYPELVFTRWLADVVAKGKEIDWEKFI